MKAPHQTVGNLHRSRPRRGAGKAARWGELRDHFHANVGDGLNKALTPQTNAQV